MTNEELYTLIQSDVDARTAYNAGNDDVCAARCGVLAPTTRKPVEASALRKLLMKRGRWAELRRIASNIASDDPPYSQATSLVDTITAGDMVDLSDADLIAGGVVLVEHNLLNHTDVQAINALGDVRQSFTQHQIGAVREWYRVAGGMNNGTT